MTDALTIVVYGESGVGKSYFADSAPGPRLILDVEGGVRFTPSRKIAWDPRSSALPEVGPEDSAVVTVRDLAAVQQAFQWLNTGQHPFRSVVIDSLSEMQQRARAAIVGSNAMRTQDWDTILVKLDQMVRAFRDLTMHPVCPIDCVVFVCGTRTGEDGIARPFLQGQMKERLAYAVDIVAHFGVVAAEDGTLQRVGTFVPIDGMVAKDRTGRLGSQIIDPTIPALFSAVYGGMAAEEVA